MPNQLDNGENCTLWNCVMSPTDIYVFINVALASDTASSSAERVPNESVMNWKACGRKP
jgi:hypothetical protein